MNPIESVKLSQKAKDQLVKMKRVTKLMQWNVLCRWALCTSLAEESVPPSADIPLDSNVEMTWRVFGGEYADIYLALLRQRCIADGLGDEGAVLAEQFKLHLHRGIGYIAADREIKSVADLARRAVS